MSLKKTLALAILFFTILFFIKHSEKLKPENLKQDARTQNIFIVSPTSGDEILSNSNSGKLFEFLFSPRFLHKLEDPQFIKQLNARLRRPYQSQQIGHHESAYEVELRTKIGVLQALRDLDPQTLSREARSNIRFLLKSTIAQPGSHWMTERLSLQAISKFGGFDSEEEREKILGVVDQRAISLASISDEDLIEGAIAHEN